MSAPASPSDDDRLSSEPAQGRSLVRNIEADEAYGFTRDPCWGRGLNVCICRIGERVTLTAKSLFLGPVRDPDREEVRKPLRMAEWDRLQLALRRADFWALPERHDSFGLDGVDWTIEGRRGDRYHRSTCWCPEKSPFFDLGRLFIELAGIDRP